MDPPIPDGGVRYCKDGREISDREQWTLHGDVFYDGSCIQRNAPGLSRATWAVVQMSSDNKAVVTVSGPVWNSLPQTAQAAEHCARTAAVELLTGPARLCGDSRNIVKDAQRPLVEACHHSRMHAAANRLAGLSPSAALVCEDLWLKAHRKPETETNDWDRFTAIGNGHADTEAVAAQGRLGYTNTPGWRTCDAKQKKMQLLCKVIGTVAALWPSAKQACGKVVRTPHATRAAKIQTAPAHPHQWTHYDGRWTCRACFTFAHSDNLQEKRSSEHCPGYCASLACVLGNTQGHAYAAVEKDGPPPHHLP